MTFTLDRGFEEEIRVHASGTPNEEVCGIIVRLPTGMTGLLAMKNHHHDKANAFHIRNADIDSALEDMGGKVIAIYHSHVKGRSSEASKSDIAASEALKLPYVIYSVARMQFTIYEPKGQKVPLIGRPFVFGVHDCYGLVKDYYERLEKCSTCGKMAVEEFGYPCDHCTYVHMGFELPEPEREPHWFMKHGRNLFMENIPGAGFVRVPLETIREHDSLLLNDDNPVPHFVMVYIGNSTVLHHPTGQLSRRGRFGGYLRSRVTDVLRHRSMLEAGDQWKP